ncbi:uncharacterized protein [Diadema setosum]|uniref:uncharacterized protein n=1 Tax=Diadema setosum TaxID=31175 RepID=UPI003B3A80EF
MHVKCYEETPFVKLVDGPSPMDGLVVLESDRYVCYDGFNIRAAELVCKELGFTAVKDFSAQTLSRSATRLNKTQRLSCPYGSQHERVQDCLSKRSECSWNKAVRLKCREPGFLGCYQGDLHTFQDLQDIVSGFSVHSDEECVSTCRLKTGNHDIGIVHDGDCMCYRSDEYANFISGVSYTHYWTPETKAEPESGQQIHCLFNLSVGFCDHPGPVSNGYWDSNITSFGSEITLTCDLGFILIGNPTLQCVGLPGWSTYFPVWNASVPSCRAVENATDDNEWHNARITITPSLITDLISSERQSIDELTTLQETIVMTSSGEHQREINITVYILGTLLCIVFILLVILLVAWCNHLKKRHRPSPASNQLNDRQLQMYPVDTSSQNSTSADYAVLDTTGTDVGAEGHLVPNNPGNTRRVVTVLEEDPYHVYQDAAELRKMASQPSSVEQMPLSAFSAERNDNTLVSKSLTSVNIPHIKKYNGLQDESLDKSENSYEDWDYQDVDLDKNDGVKESASRSPGGARLFDDRCYDSLTFTKRSDSTCTQRQDACSRPTNLSDANEGLENEYTKPHKHGDFPKSTDMLIDHDYDHINFAYYDDTTQIHYPTHPSNGQTLQSKDHSYRKGNIPHANIDSETGATSEDVFYFQLEQGESKDMKSISSPVYPDAFDSSDYSLLNPEEPNEILLPDVRGLDSMRDTKKPISEKLVICEELYAKVDKTRVACNADDKTGLHEEMYAEVKETVGPSLLPVMCEGLYAEVDKTRESCNVDAEPASHEEMYMDATDI